MRKTRILASLLCIMMIVCSLPMIQASAAVGDTYADVSAILGFQAEKRDNLSYNFEGALTAPAGSTTNVYNRAATATAAGITGTVNYGTEGIEFVSEDTTIWYTFAAKANPYKEGTATVITFKFPSASDKLNIQFNNPHTASTRVYSDVTATQIKSNGSSASTAAYSFGTDWNDIMYVLKSTGYQIYVRKTAEGGAWTLLQDIVGYRTGATSGFMSLSTVAGTDGTIIKSMTTYGRKYASEESITGVIGADAIVKEPGADFKFTEGFTTATGVTTPNGAEYDNTNGLDLTAVDAAIGKASWRYLPANGYSPFNSSDALVFKAKIPAGGALNVQAYVPITVDGAAVVSRVYMDINETKATLSAASSNGSFAPGNDWVEYMVIKNGSTGLKLYVKSDNLTNGEWVLNSTINDGSYKSGGGVGTGIAFYSTCTDTDGNGTATTHTGAYVQYCTVYQAVETYDSMDTILGGVTGSTHDHVFDANSSFANTPAPTTANPDAVRNSYMSVTGFTSDANGLTLVDAADTTSTFKYGPFTKSSPLNTKAFWSSTTTYAPQAFYIQAKGGFALSASGPNGLGRIYMVATVGSNLVVNQDSVSVSVPVTLQDEDVEYLFVPNNRTEDTNVTAAGYTLYIKGAATTNGKWWKVREGAYNGASTNYSSHCITFSCVTGHIKRTKTLSLNASVAEENTIPDGADYLWVNEGFGETPAYTNKYDTHIAYTDGNAVFPSTDEVGSLTYAINGASLPIGGYVEFRVQYSGAATYTVGDGTSYVSIAQYSDYGGVTSNTAGTITGYTGDGNSSWRTWRVVRTDAGYTVYSKADGDSGWFNHGTDAGKANATNQIAIKFSERNDGGTGDSKLDYIKVYAPAPTGVLTLTDGYSVKAVTDGATLAYEGTLRAIVNEETGKLLVVAYNGNDMVTAQIVNVADIVDNSVFVDAKVSGATKVKVFLWDSFSGLNRKTPAVTLNL